MPLSADEVPWFSSTTAITLVMWLVGEVAAVADVSADSDAGVAMGTTAIAAAANLTLVAMRMTRRLRLGREPFGRPANAPTGTGLRRRSDRDTSEGRTSGNQHEPGRLRSRRQASLAGCGPRRSSTAFVTAPSRRGRRSTITAS